MAFSLNANTNQADGHAKNTVTGNDTNNRDRYSLRADLLIETADDLEIRITADYDEYDEFCCQVGNVSAGPAKTTRLCSWRSSCSKQSIHRSGAFQFRLFFKR